MERTIRFRGKRLDNGEWMYGDLLHIANEVFIAPSDGDWFDFIPPWSKNNVFRLPAAQYAVMPDTVGQYTEIRDRDNQQIFEGDILQLMDSHRVDETVVVEHGLYGWTFYNPLTATFYRDGSHTYSAVENYRFMFGTGRIIGNIHDTPELAIRGKANEEDNVQ